MRPVEQRTADEDEEEQADERLLPMGRERCVRRGIGRPEAERGREEQEEHGDREEERGDEAANREEAPQQRLEEHLGLAGLLVRMDGLAARVEREGLAGGTDFFGHSEA